jgi:hypothetical protein
VRTTIGMSISDQTEVGFEKPLSNVLLFCSLFIALTDGDYRCHKYTITEKGRYLLQLFADYLIF